MAAGLPPNGSPGSPAAAPEDLGWEHAIRLFLEAWGADHPRLRPHTLEHYRAHVGDLTRYDLRAFVSLEEGRARVRTEISKGRRARPVDQPLTIEDGQG